ncbi:unnamed protein product [Mytilus edulis]|uniref:Ankyrin repeat protein n=1 Tax=Mytilus edulis TaxID=6550 RepID=A0A8S3RD59_MYTED|nr:unnamed protein product [Mytilus edulis]
MEEEPSTSGGIKRSIPKELQNKMDETAAKIPRVTATPAVLDDNKKRYLVVGICLHSVISPALRKYVVPVLTALYEELILTQNIDTQTYSAHLKQYLPTNTKLNYKAVNNNETANGKANYDYKIKSVVDLSKLFLLPHMAYYTGFDETCDLSALLGLIINIDDKFSSAVISYAEDVRPRTLDGTNEICQLLNVLVESLICVANDTDTNSLETKKAQENLATISSTLFQLQNYMETRFSEINKVKENSEKGCTKVVATCRLDIYNDEKFKEAYSGFKSNIFNLSERYTREDKIKICRNYISEAEIQLVQEQNVDFTPLMCYLHSKNQSFNLTDFLECPFKTYQEEWEKFKALDPYKYCSLFLCVIYNGIMTESFDLYIENSTKNRQDWENIFEICGINRDIQVFNQRTQLESVNEPSSKFTIMISKKYEKEYFERIKSDVQLGKLNHCFYNTHMKYKAYRTSFIKILKSIDDEVLIPQIYQKPKNPSYGRHTDYSFETEGPFIKSFLRGYYGICRYFISKNVDLKKCDSDYSLLTAACQGGNEMIVQLLLDKGNDVNQVDGMKRTPLSAACSKGNEKIVMLLVDKGGDVNQVCSDGRTPLTAACYGRHENIVQLLIDKGSDVNQVDDTLAAACSRGNEKIVKLLIDRGSYVNKIGRYDQTPLTTACERGNEKIVQLLLDRGSDVNKVRRNGKDTLTAACERGNKNIVQLLLDRGSDVNQVDGKEQTPLTAACLKGNENIVESLLEKGIDVNMVDKGCDVNKVWSNNKTPLTTACIGGNENIVQLLIDRGSDVKLMDGHSLTIACEGGNEKIVQVLIANGSDVNQVNDKENTALTMACKYRNEKIVQVLIDNRSDVNQVDGLGMTPLTVACSGRNENERMFDEQHAKYYGTQVDNMIHAHIMRMTISCSGGDEKIVQLLIYKGSNVNQANGMGITPLSAACKGENEKIVQKLIDNGSDVNQILIHNGSGVNQVEKTGETPLTVACRGGNQQIVQLLIENGSVVNQADKTKQSYRGFICFEENGKIYSAIDYGSEVEQVAGMGKTPDEGSDINQVGGKRTPLTAACNGGDEKIVQLLIDKGCDVNRVDDMKQTPLMSACRGWNTKIVQLLLEKECDVNQDDGKRTPLTAACSRANEKIVQLLLDKGCDVNQVDGKGQSPLTAACNRGDEELVQLLLDKGSNVNHVDTCGGTPLTISCYRGNGKIVQLLLDRGSEVNQVDDMKQTPLTSACSGGNKKIVQLLLEKECDVNQDDGKRTPLTAACNRGDEELVQLLLEKGCDVNQVDGKGQTPLMAFCSGSSVFLFYGERRREKIVQLLLDKGSNLNKADTYGETLLTAACNRGNEKIVQLLLDKGISLNQVDDMKQTPLTAACSGGNEKIVQLLIDKGCDVNQVDGKGLTPLTAACIRGNEKIVQLLIDKGCDVNQVDGKGQTPLMAARYGENEQIIQLFI